MQFGRPIGQFQGVKHKCADMLGRVELARAAVWDAARAVDDGDAVTARDVGRARARARRRVRERQGLRAGARRHRLHVGARRARLPATRDGDAQPRRRAVGVADARGAGAPSPATVARCRSTSGPMPRRSRTELRAFLGEVRDLEPPEQRRRVADAGYLTPTWPAPWGRAARAVEQTRDRPGVPRRGVPRPSIVIGGLGAAAGDHVRHRGAAAALDPADPARRHLVVPAVQ